MIGDPRPAVTNYISRHEMTEATYPSLAALMREISAEMAWVLTLPCAILLSGSLYFVLSHVLKLAV